MRRALYKRGSLYAHDNINKENCYATMNEDVYAGS